MLSKLLAGALGLIAPLATLTVTASPANAEATPHCITRNEFHKIQHGMSVARVRHIVGATGRVSNESTFSDGDGWKTIDFRQCGKSWNWSDVSIDFEKTEIQVWDPYWEDYETEYVAPYIVTGKYAYWF